jgi:hypothetical protein
MDNNMTFNYFKFDFMKIIRFILAGLFLALTFLAFSQSPGNFSTLRVTTLDGNMKANGTSLVTADTLLLKADTVRADAELYVRDSTLLEIIQANSSGIEVVGNVNNRVLTATGGDSIQGEANLTFDGSTANITGQLNVDNLRLDGNTISSQTSGGITLNPRSGEQLRIIEQSGTNGLAFLRSSSTVFSVNYTSNSFSSSLPAFQINTGDGSFNIGNPIISTSSIATTRSGSGNGITSTHSGSGNALAINQTGTGSGLVVTNSGGGVALQAGNISVDGNTLSSTSGDITLTPTSDVNISSGGLEIGGTEVISSSRAISGTTGNFSSTITSDNNGVIQAKRSGINQWLKITQNASISQIIAETGNSPNYPNLEILQINNVPTPRVAASFDTNGYINIQGIYNETTASAANVFVDTDGSLRRSTSSRRYKDSIQTLTISEDVFKQIRPVSYKSKTDSLQYFGYIAEEIDSIGLKQLVTYDTNGNPDALQYGQFTAVNTAMIQKLLTRIEELEARITELEGN